jgi:hypothetical protein
MTPDELRGELERLAEETRTARVRLGELGGKIAAACEEVASIRSTLRGVESTSGPQVVQEEAGASGT